MPGTPRSPSGEGRWGSRVRAPLVPPPIVLSFAVLVAAPSVRAQAGLSVHWVEDDEALRVDGALSDWPRGSFVQMGEGRDGALRLALAHSRAGLYLAADVRDERLVRTPPAGRDDDAVVLHVAVPRRRGWARFELWLWPGGAAPGAGRVRAEAAVRRGRRFRRVRGARVVEMPLEGKGWRLEAFLPWTVLRRLAPGDWQRARAVVQFRDVDAFARGRPERVLDSAPWDRSHPERWPPFQWRGGHHEAFATFLMHRGLVGIEPDRRLSADLTGDGRPEEVALVGTELVAWGPGHREGRGYDSVRLPVAGAGDVLEMRARDVWGDAGRELLVRYRERLPDGERKVLAVYRLGSNGWMRVAAFETWRATRAGELAASVRFERGARRGEVWHRALPPPRAPTPSAWRPVPGADVLPVPRPWRFGRVGYRWRGGRLERVAEVPPSRRLRRTFERALRARGERTRASGPPDVPRSSMAEGPGDRAVVRGEPVADDASLLAHARRHEGLPEEATRLLLRADLLGGRTPERVYQVGDPPRWLVVLGPDVGGGRGYLLWQSGGAGARIRRVEAANLGGSGHAELIVHLVRELGSFVSFQVHVMGVGERGIHRLGAIEVGRRVEERVLENRLRVVRRHGRAVLLVEPGRVHGFSARNWPFARGFVPHAGLEPPLLPWESSRGAVRWRVRGGRLVRAPR